MTLDKFHYHEMVDRVHCIRMMLHEMVSVHPVSTEHPELAAAIGAAEKALGDLYQLAGRIDHEHA